MSADAQKEEVAVAQTYFALIIDSQALEDDKRIRARYEVNDENRRLQGAARSSGVEDFRAFNGSGVSALYGGLSVSIIQARKGLKKGQHYLDFAGSEELAANLFRITQTRAALERQGASQKHDTVSTRRRISRLRTAKSIWSHQLKATAHEVPTTHLHEASHRAQAGDHLRNLAPRLGSFG
jgi:DNA-damage-inducible protein D